jgi:hypothetical protein
VDLPWQWLLLLLLLPIVDVLLQVSGGLVFVVFSIAV